MTAAQFEEIKRFNQNIEWLKSSQTTTESKNYINFKEAMNLLQRSRTWLQVRMQKRLLPGMNVNENLIRDADWIREGNRIMFKKQSIVRLKNEALIASGNHYDAL